MMRKNIFCLIMLIIINGITCGNEQQDKDQKFIELIKKTYANKKFPLIYAFKVLSNFCSQHKNAVDITGLMTQSNIYNNHELKQLEELKYLLYAIRNSQQYKEELSLKKIDESNPVASIRNCLLLLAIFSGIDLFLRLKFIYRLI